jgi:anti-sigma factor RsiW
MKREPWSERPDGCASDLVLDRLVVGELRPSEAGAIRGHARGCAGCAARLAAFEEGKATFDAAPARLTLPAGPPATPAWRRLWIVPAAAAVVSALLLFVVLERRDAPGPDAAAGTRRKGGGAAFRLHVGRAGAVLRVVAGDVVHPGERLQLTYSSDEPGFVAVLARDGAGAVSVYFPVGAATAWPAPPGQDRPLPASTMLDGVLGLETIFALHCADPIEIEPVRARLAAGATGFPRSCTVEELSLEKREPG